MFTLESTVRLPKLKCGTAVFTFESTVALSVQILRNPDSDTATTTSSEKKEEGKNDLIGEINNTMGF